MSKQSIEYSCEEYDEEQDRPTKYSKISFKKRKRLIQMVKEQQFSIYRASRLLDISNSTAKVIIRNYNRQNRVLQRSGQNKNSKIKKMNVEQTIEDKSSFEEKTRKEQLILKDGENYWINERYIFFYYTPQQLNFAQL